MVVELCCVEGFDDGRDPTDSSWSMRGFEQRAFDGRYLSDAVWLRAEMDGCCRFDDRFKRPAADGLCVEAPIDCHLNDSSRAREEPVFMERGAITDSM